MARKLIWNEEKCRESALLCKTQKEFTERFPSAFGSAYKRGWLKDYTWFEKLVENRWDYDSTYKEAQKYRTKKEFQRNCSGGYSAAWSRGWLKDYTWFENGNLLVWEGRRIWTKEKCFEEAKKHKNRSTMHDVCPGAYFSALHNNWLDEMEFNGEG